MLTKNKTVTTTTYEYDENENLTKVTTTKNADAPTNYTVCGDDDYEIESGAECLEVDLDGPFNRVQLWTFLSAGIGAIAGCLLYHLTCG